MKRIQEIVLSLLIITALIACSKPQSFEYKEMRNLKLENLGFEKTALSMELVYFNPNKFAVDLRKVDCDVFVENKFLGKFTLDTLMHIPKLAEFSLPSRIAVDMKSIFKNALTVLVNKEVTVQVKGTTRVGKSGIFITVPFTYEGKHSFSLF